MENTLNTNTGSSPTEHAGEMDAATLEALKGSIAKWEGIVAGAVQDEGELNCPLCAKFNDCVNNLAEPACGGCPVAEKTGVEGCLNTPYVQFSKLKWSAPGPDRVSAMAAAAQAELDFLKSLLPDAAELSKGEKL